MSKRNVIGLIMTIIGALGLLSIFGYGIFTEFGWVGTVIYTSILIICLGTIVYCSGLK